MADTSPPPLPPKPRRKDVEPMATDIAERMIAFQRRTAAATRPKDRAERPKRDSPTSESSNLPPAPGTSRQTVPLPSPPLVSLPPAVDPDPNADDFSRRLRISNSPRASHTHAHASARNDAGPSKQKLYNPDSDPVPVRRTAEPEAISDTASSSHAGRAPPPKYRDAGPHRLFDPSKDDPVKFGVRAQQGGVRPQPTPKSSGDYISGVSASSTSSYAASLSSSFTLSSGASGSSAPSSLFERQRAAGDSGSSETAFAQHLKAAYRKISALETKIMNAGGDDPEEEGRVMVKVRKDEAAVEVQKDKWAALLEQHIELADMMHNLLRMCVASNIPASLRVIPTKYNIIVRLWTHAFYSPLEKLRRASLSSPIALERLQLFIYYAYTFYTVLVEDPSLEEYRGGWLEALGDLARYRMAICGLITATVGRSESQHAVSSSSLQVSSTSTRSDDLASLSKAISARIDDSPSPSVGLAAARALEIEPEKERWRRIAREWYAKGLMLKPNDGKLHHHLGLLSREADGEDLRAVYHYVKSLTTLHPFSTSRESILPIWSSAQQARRSFPDARVSDLFVLLHGMIFTNIQLDDFQPTLARLLERLQLEGAEEREWIMMGIINVGALFEYGRAQSVLRKALGGASTKDSPLAGKVRIAKRTPTGEDGQDDKKLDADVEMADVVESPVLSEPETIDELPPTFKYALQVAFGMFSYTLRNPYRGMVPFQTLNPYNVIMLTFLTTVMRSEPTISLLERLLPWDDLAAFFRQTPRSLLSQADNGVRLTTAASPLPEDWCLRGMEWLGRKVYERGFWKGGEDRLVEMEVLDKEELAGEFSDGIIEDEGDDDADMATAVDSSDMNRRWIRVLRAGAGLEKVTNGLNWRPGTREWSVDGALRQKVDGWKEDERRQLQDEEERRLRKRRVDDDDAMEVDGEFDDSEESEVDEADSEEVKALKARRRYLRSLLQTDQRISGSPPSRHRAPRRQQEKLERQPLHLLPGYSVLVVDTNVLLSSLSMISSLIESHSWTVVVPLPVVMELDGLSSNGSELGEAALAAIAYISSHLRPHANSLKVQTSKGNYLTSLSVRTEDVDFHDHSSWERSMDDLILRAAIWQDDHWVDRSALLNKEDNARDLTNAVKVVLLTFDRNLRLKARARQLPAADERDMAKLLASG